MHPNAMFMLVAQTAESAANAVTEALKEPPAPTGLGAVDYIVIAILIFGVVRGFKSGFTGEIWSLIGTAVVVAVPFFLFAPLSPKLQPFFGAIVNKAYADWLSFLMLTFSTLLVYELIHVRLLGKVNLMMWSQIETLCGMIAGALRMALVCAWLLSAILLMPNVNLMHLFCGWRSQTGYTLMQYSPVIKASARSTYVDAEAELAELKKRLDRKELDLDTGKPK
jgi:uncharacterized membrane protein required for colicin V production